MGWKGQVPLGGLEMKFSFHSDFHFLLVTPPKWFRECLLVFLDILYDLQASLERSRWLNSTPARCPSAPVEHPCLSNSRMLNKLRRLPVHRLNILWSLRCHIRGAGDGPGGGWQQLLTGLSRFPSSFLDTGKISKVKTGRNHCTSFNRAHVCFVHGGLKYSSGFQNHLS